MNRCIHAAESVVLRHGITPDRREILQNGHTLVVRLTESLVARVISDRDGPRQGASWFDRETAIAAHLTRHHAPVIPLHPALPPVAHTQNGFTMNFWQFVNTVDATPNPKDMGSTLHTCHQYLRSLPEPLPSLAILHECLALLEPHDNQRHHFPTTTLELLRGHLTRSLSHLSNLPHQPLHGDAHMGNLMNTTLGLLWTDWEDSFSGPVEWDLASLIWNARLLDYDHTTANAILDSYQESGGNLNPSALHHCLIARAAVMSAWYPILYPNPSAERAEKLQHRLDWLKEMEAYPPD